MRVSPRFALVAAAFATLAHATPAQIPDARENDDPVATYWASGRTAADVTALVGQGFRLTNLHVEGTNPWTFTVAMAQNTGTYQTGWWWYYDVTTTQISQLLQQNNGRLIDLEPIDTGAGGIRHACVMVSNAGADQKGWNWLVDATSAAVANLVGQGKRIVDLEQYAVGGQTRFACVAIDNVGADARAWWYYYNVSATTLASLLAQNNARVFDLDGVGTNFNVVMTGQASPAVKTWRLFGVSGSQLTDQLSQIGARLIDVERYFTFSGYRYNAVLINNSNPLSTRISELLRGYGDGHSGVYLKEVGGPTLAYINADRVHEPASALKTLHLARAMKAVQQGQTALTTQYTTYTGYSGNSCPLGAGASINETLESVLDRMMQDSDNARTRTVTDNFGGFAGLNATATSLGMASTVVRHHIGCGTDVLFNDTTLRDIGQLHEQVANGWLGAQREAFYSRMLANESIYAGGELGNVISSEATAIGLSVPQRDAFLAECRVLHKPGGYGTAAGFSRTWSAYAEIPRWSNGQVTLRRFVSGAFCHNAAVEQNAIDAANRAAAEALRDEIRAALATWSNAPLGVATAVGAGCGTPQAVQGAGPMRPGLGRTAQYSLANGFASSPLVWAIGFSSTSAGGVPLPFPLQLVGAQSGCQAYNDLAITFSGMTSATGGVSGTIPIPYDLGLIGFTYFTQFYSLDVTGAQPFVVSNGMRSVVGL